MAMPRMTPRDGVAWVTGAASGIGAAVALELARQGWTVAITARRLDRLEAVARQAEGLAGRIVAHVGDVTDAEGQRRLVETIETVHGPIALAFLNAGIAPPRSGALVDAGGLAAAVEINLLGTARSLAAVCAPMAERGRGRIAVNASLAGYGGRPGAAAYGASKAGLINFCEALQPDLARQGLVLQVVNPGYVETPLLGGRHGGRPFLMPAGEAARRIVAGFDSDRFEIAFPRRAAWAMKLLRLLPYPLWFRAVGGRGAPGQRPNP